MEVPISAPGNVVGKTLGWLSLVGPVIFFILNTITLSFGIMLYFIGIDLLHLEIGRTLSGDGETSIEYTDNLREEMQTAVKVLNIASTLTGIWLCFIGFLGMVAAVLNNKCLLMIYLNLMAVSLLVWLIFMNAFLYVMGLESVHTIAKLVFLSELHVDYGRNEGSENTFQRLADRVQVELSCCGMDNYTEFQDTAKIWYVNHSRAWVIPESCCHLNKMKFRNSGKFLLKDPNCMRSPALHNSYIDQPCYGKIEKLMKSQKQMVIITIWNVAFLKIVLIGLSIYLLFFGESLLCGL